MKKQLKKWILRLSATALLIAVLLLVIILNPILTYGNKTNHNNFTVYHYSTLDSALLPQLDKATVLLQQSEFYNAQLKLDICLNDGSLYPGIIKQIKGPAFAWGFYNKVVLQGTANYSGNTVELNGMQWNLCQLLAHEMTHCMQYDHLGLRRSNPIAGIPEWKWEGYAEYVARKDQEQQNLAHNIERLIAANKLDKDSWEIKFEDGTVAPRSYYNYWLLVQYCMDIKKMSYAAVLKDNQTETVLRNEMMQWFEKSRQ